MLIIMINSLIIVQIILILHGEKWDEGMEGGVRKDNGVAKNFV